MSDSLNNDLAKISEWGLANRVDFNASKTQGCLLTHKRTPDLSPKPNISGVDIDDAGSIEILGMNIQNDLRWNSHIFNVAKDASKCLGFLKRCKKYFSAADLKNIYTTFIRPKMEYNSHIWAGASRISLELLDRVQRRAIKLIGDSGISSSIDSLGHRRNVGCVALFYRYFTSCRQ